MPCAWLLPQVQMSSVQSTALEPDDDDTRTESHSAQCSLVVFDPHGDAGSDCPANPKPGKHSTDQRPMVQRTVVRTQGGVQHRWTIHIQEAPSHRSDAG